MTTEATETLCRAELVAVKVRLHAQLQTPRNTKLVGRDMSPVQCERTEVMCGQAPVSIFNWKRASQRAVCSLGLAL